MTRKSFLLLATIGMLFLLIPTAKANGYWFPMVLNSNINTPLLSLQYYHKEVTTQHDQEKFEFNWTSGIIAINYYIFNRVNFINWSLGLPSTIEGSVENITADADVFYTYGVNQTWVFVWFNPSLLATQLIGTYERYRWIEVESTIPGFPWEAILLGAISAVTISIILRKKVRQD